MSAETLAYEPFETNTQFYRCPHACGAAVVNSAQHEEWHQMTMEKTSMIIDCLNTITRVLSNVVKPPKPTTKETTTATAFAMSSPIGRRRRRWGW